MVQVLALGASHEGSIPSALIIKLMEEKMSKIIEFLTERSDKCLKSLVRPCPTLFIATKFLRIKYSYYDRLVANELRKRGYRVSLRYGAVTKK